MNIFKIIKYYISYMKKNKANLFEDINKRLENLIVKTEKLNDRSNIKNIKKKLPSIVYNFMIRWTIMKVN